MSLLDIQDRETRKVEIKGGFVFVRSITAGEQIDLSAAEAAAGDDIRKLLVAQLCAYVSDEVGNAILTVEDAEKAVANRRPESVKTILREAQDLNGITSKSAEDIRGN